MDSVDHNGLLSLARRWWWLLALSAVAAGFVGWAWASLAQPTYRADTKLLVGPVNTDSQQTLDASGQLGRTYSDLATSRPLLQQALRRTDTAIDVDDFSEDVTATANDVSRLVTISVENPDRDRAARLSNALAARLRTLSQDSPVSDRTAVAELMRDSDITSLTRGQRNRVEAAAQRVLGTSQAGILTVVDPAEPPEDPVAPKIPLITLLTAMGGLLIAGVLVFLKDAGRQSMVDERALSELVHPFLGWVDVPSLHPSGGALPVEGEPSSATAELFRLLAHKIGLVVGRSSMHTLLVVDPDEGATSAVLAANLAAVVGETDRRVLLVDASGAAGGVTSLMNLEGEPGYGELVASATPRAQLNGKLDRLRVPHSETVEILPRGAPEPAGLLDVKRAQRLLQRLTRVADLVIICAPPLHRSPAGQVWARVADGTVLAVEDGRSTRDAVGRSVASLSYANARVVGTVSVRRHAPATYARREPRLLGAGAPSAAE
jgi:Mrp family chromosome partitioning ATPase/capsular polysaccharide biosynthesis protein